MCVLPVLTTQAALCTTCVEDVGGMWTPLWTILTIQVRCVTCVVDVDAVCTTQPTLTMWAQCAFPVLTTEGEFQFVLLVLCLQCVCTTTELQCVQSVLTI